MAEFTMTEVQKKLLESIPEERLELVQYVGKQPGRAGNAPGPSGVLVDEFGLDNGYGRVTGGTIMYVLKEDARYTKYFKKSRAKIAHKEKLKEPIKAKPAAKKGEPGKVTVER